MLGGDAADAADAVDDDARALLDDLEDDIAATGESRRTKTRSRHPTPCAAELQRVEDYITERARLGAEDSKFRALLQALRFVTERGVRRAARKLVIFTESRVTQSYLRDSLVASRLITDDEITLFSGTNDAPRAHAGAGAVDDRGAAGRRRRPNRDIAMRLALVHEFKTRTRVFISTEAGAKGLNLQFCDTLVNYDLPWNPQRIEQRIGRVIATGSSTT